jgi:hypothetical protein
VKDEINFESGQEYHLFCRKNSNPCIYAGISNFPGTLKHFFIDAYGNMFPIENEIIQLNLMYKKG